MGFDGWLAERFALTNEGRASWVRGIREFECPFCKRGDNKFWFNLASMRGGCLHKATCGWRGDAVQLVAQVDGLSLGMAIREVRRWLGEDTSWWQAARAEQVVQIASDGECQLPTEFVAMLRGDGRMSQSRAAVAAAAYLGQRGVTAAEIQRHRFGYCASGLYSDRIVMPVVEQGELVYFVARLFRGKGKPYRYPTVEQAGGRGPTDVLFNLDGVRGRPRVRVVEGVFDALAEERRGEAAVAMLGLTLSETQAAKLALAGCLEAIVECDGDAPLREIEKIVTRLAGVMRVSVAQPERDPDDTNVSPAAGRWGIAERVRARLERCDG